MTENHADKLEPKPLPEPVRARVITLSADALARMPEQTLPASLKRVASFAPNRRAKLAGAQIAAALENDEEFRTRLATQVRAGQPEMAAALESGTPPAAADPTDLAALAYLLRPRGWESVVETATRAVSADRVSAAERRYAEQIERLRLQLDDATKELKSVRRRHSMELAEMKTENAELRRKLGDTRSRIKLAETAADRARDEAVQASAKAATDETASQAEVRRLRSRVEELEAALGDRRRSERSQRDTEGVRARLLLDTLLESAQGLRRELALPAVAATPAEMVERKMLADAGPSVGHRGSTVLDDSRRLDQLLSLPRAHLIVDGYNVTMSAWPETSLEQQRDRLIAQLAPLAARTAAEITIVFDAAEKQQRPLVNRPRGLRVLFSPMGVIADDIIRDLVTAEPLGRPVVVVTSDQAVLRDVVRDGAKAAHATALSDLLAGA